MMTNQDVDIVIEDAYTLGRDSPVNLAIEDGLITGISADRSFAGDTLIDADGRFVSPGLFECHLHMDKALDAAGGRVPPHNDGSTSLADIIRTNREYFAEATVAEMAQNATDVVEWGVTNGILYYRSQTYTGATAGLDAIEGLLDAQKAVSEIADIQIVAFPQDGIWHDENETAIREAMALGADLVGGIDPGAQNADVETTVETWFDIAEAHQKDIDVHIHEPESLGMYSMNCVSDAAIDRGFDGNVTLSHAYALADLNANASYDDRVYPGGTLENTIDRFVEADLNVVTCYPSTRPAMPIRELFEAGVPVGLATDNVQTYSDPRQSADIVQGALIEAYTLEEKSRSYLTNPGLSQIWEMITHGAAAVFGIEENYGIEIGNPADMVLFDAPSPQRAIIDQAQAEYVFKDGAIVAVDGELQEGPE